MVTHQLQIRWRSGKVRRSETNVLPLSYTANKMLKSRYMTEWVCVVCCFRGWQSRWVCLSTSRQDWRVLSIRLQSAFWDLAMSSNDFTLTQPSSLDVWRTVLQTCLHSVQVKITPWPSPRASMCGGLSCRLAYTQYR